MAQQSFLSAVIGVPHKDFGKAVAAVIFAKDGVMISAQDISNSIKDDLARFKQPKRIEFAEILPRNAMGKVQKNFLRAAYGGFFQESAPKGQTEHSKEN